MFKKKSLFGKRRAESEECALQITSMADIFTILLVFLLKSYATGAISAQPSLGTILPSAQGGEAAIEALKVEVSEKGVNIEGKPIVSLAAFEFPNGDIQPNGSSELLSKGLERERQRQLLIARTNSDVKVDARIIVMADQKVPYQTLKSVLASAALNGYTDFKLAVIKGE